VNSLFGAFAATIHGAFVILACIVIASIGFGIALTVFAAHAENLIVLGIVAYAVAQYQKKSNHKVGKHEKSNQRLGEVPLFSSSNRGISAGRHRKAAAQI
jgi:hypothetical protein